MNNGRKTCDILKAIRRRIAEANGISLEYRVCRHEGDCAGTCPRCEEEVRYLERQLDLRRMLGKSVALIGLSAGLSAVMTLPSSCMQVTGDVPDPRAVEMPSGDLNVQPSDSLNQETHQGMKGEEQVERMLSADDGWKDGVMHQ